MSLDLNYEEYRLPNGLLVILHEDHSTPIVAVNIWYRVGSKNERAGKTGFAHLFEHLMFEGSKHHDREYFAPLQEAGANVNGSTNADRTNYYETLPSNFLELALWLEADRMGYLLDAMTQEKLDNQRDVVKNEKRQRYDNVPYGSVGETIARLMYPENHPYSWLTIGSMADLSAASLDDVKNFFRAFYVPNNASLVLAGDFQPNEAKGLIEKYFAPLKANDKIERPNAPKARLEAEIRHTITDKVALPRVYLAWHTVPFFDPDEAALDMLASILTAGRASRLQSNLVFGKQIAQDVSASHFTRELAGQFQIISTSKPGDNLAEIEREIFAEIERIKQELPTAEEMTRALNTRESAFVFGLQTVQGKADQLNEYAAFTSEPNYFAEDLNRYRRVTAADVSRVAVQYLTGKRLILTVAPGEKAAPNDFATNGAQTDQNNKKHQSAKTNVEQSAEQDSLYRQPTPKPAPRFALPRIERATLANNLEVVFVEQNRLPVVSLNLVVKSGGATNSVDRAGLANLTASLLNQGTKNRSAEQISNELLLIGASLGAGAGWDSASVALQTLTKNFDRALDVFADVAVNPIFPEPEFETQRSRLLTAFLQQKDSANAIANRVFNRVLYGENNVYGNSLAGDERSVAAIKRDDLQRHYAAFYRPNNAALIVVGAIDKNELLPALERAFAGWKPAEVPKVESPGALPREQSAIYLVDKSGAAQSVVTIGHAGVARANPDYFALVVMNSLLGGQFTSRVNMNLREDKGFTYGARTGFEFRRGKGPFSASTSVQSAVTKAAIEELLKELDGVRGAIPVTEKELEYNKQSIVRRFPANFETVGQIAAQLAAVAVYDLPDSYFDDYSNRINAVTLADVNRVANQYLTPERTAILVVGDKQTVEPSLRQLDSLEINFLNAEGQPLSETK